MKENNPVRWSRVSQVTIRRYDDGGILIDHSSGNVFEANELGALIWELLEEPLTTAELVEDLSACFDETIPELPADTESYLTLLQKHRLIAPIG